MGLFSGIMSKIFGHPAGAKPTPPAAKPAAATLVGTPAMAAAPASAAPVAAPPSPPPAAAPVPAAVDVTAVLDDLASKSKEKLDWRRSIVDLMKLVGIDSSLSARKELADELGYSGDKGNSADMNVWLHREVIRKLAANGGQVPADLLD